jgi:hypothetical protein
MEAELWPKKAGAPLQLWYLPEGEQSLEDTMKKIAVAALFAATATGMFSVAHAETFDLTYTGTAFSLDAKLDATDLGGGQYLVTGLGGALTDGGGSEQIALISGGPGAFSTPSSFFIADNVLYDPPSGLYFDSYGLAFTASGAEWNLWGVGGSPAYTLYEHDLSTGFNQQDYGSVAVSQVPESSTWAMMLLGFAGLGYAGFRRASAPRIA